MKLNKPVFITLLTTLVVLLGVGAYWYRNRSADIISNDDTINYGPATETEKTETEQHKQDLAKKDDADGSTDEENNDQGKRIVTPVISFWGQQSDGSDLELNGYVPGITESNGNCTATLVKGQSTVKETKVALEDAQTTSCGLIIVPRNKLSAGDWQLTLSYNSPISAGSSESVKVTIK